MSIHHDYETLGFRDLPAFRRRRERTPNRYAIFAAGFVTALLLMAMFS